MSARLHSFATDIKTVLTGFIRRPAAHPGFDIRRWMMEDWLFKNYGFWFWLSFWNLSAALKVQSVRFPNYRVTRYAAGQFLSNLPRR
jgi:hypothetical protein